MLLILELLHHKELMSQLHLLSLEVFLLLLVELLLHLVREAVDDALIFF